MSTAKGKSSTTECDLKSFDDWMDDVKTTMKVLKEFNSEFSEFIDDQKKIAKELLSWVTRYNILNA